MVIEKMKLGSGVIIVIFDDIYFDIVMIVISYKMYVLVVKFLVKILEEYEKLIEVGKEYNVLVVVEMYKRFDLMYFDVCDCVCSYGDFSYMNSYMS